MVKTNEIIYVLRIHYLYTLKSACASAGAGDMCCRRLSHLHGARRRWRRRANFPFSSVLFPRHKIRIERLVANRGATMSTKNWENACGAFLMPTKGKTVFASPLCTDSFHFSKSTSRCILYLRIVSISLSILVETNYRHVLGESTHVKRHCVPDYLPFQWHAIKSMRRELFSS